MEAEEEVAKILEDCGFIDNLLKDMEINEKIKELEKKARQNKPQTSGKKEPLTWFLPKDEALELRDLRIEKQKLKIKEESDMQCAQREIKKHNIITVKTKKGIFAEQPPFTIKTIKEVNHIKK